MPYDDNDDDDSMDIFDRINKMFERVFDFSPFMSVDIRGNILDMQRRRPDELLIEHDYRDGVLTLTIDMNRFIEDSIHVELDRQTIILTAVDMSNRQYRNDIDIAKYIGEDANKKWSIREHEDFVETNNGTLTVRVRVITQNVRDDIYG